TTRSVGIVTKAMGLLKPGDQIGVRGPYGSHWPLNEENGRDLVIISGGIGLAPLRPVLYFLMAQREKYRKIVLLYGARAPFDPSNTVALLCGPEVMMRFAVMELQKRGVPHDRIYLSMERNMRCAL